MRKHIVAGNWKMNKSVEEAVRLATDIKLDLAQYLDTEVVLCPPFTALKAVGDVISGTSIWLGAQNMHWEKEGAFTGEISSTMLRSVYCRYVILGHSERRTFFHETDADVNRKMKAALAGALQPIVCVGETLEQRKSDQTKAVIESQVRKSLNGAGDGINKIVVAYEPVWAIGTGLTASPDQAQEVHAFIRGILTDMFGHAHADGVRIQYGGSVKPANAKEIFSQPDVDGGLIGGAALDARSFVDIVKASSRK